MKMIYNTFVYDIQKCHKWGDIEVLLYSTSCRYYVCMQDCII